MPPTRPSEPAIQTAARLLAQGRPDEAARRLGALAAEAPTYAAAHVLHATALEAAGRPGDALDAWARAAALVPRSPLVHRERGRLLAVRRGDGGHAAPADAAPADPLTSAPEPPPEAVTPAEPEPAAAPPADVPVDAPPPSAGAEPRAPLADGERRPDAGAAPDVPEVEAEHAAPREDDERQPEERQPEERQPEERQPEERQPEERRPVAEWGAPPPPDPDVPRPLDVADLFFGDPFEHAPATPNLDAEPDLETEPSPEPEPAFEPEPDVEPDPEPEPADLLPPEGDAQTAPPPPEEPAPADETDGWLVLAEEAAPPRPLPEPDVVTPEEAPPGGEGFGEADGAGYSVADELDSLISQLEDAPRIRPDPTFSGPAVSFDTEDVDEVASETLAKIYAAQRQYAEAAAVYERLAARQPARAAEFQDRAAEMRERA